MSPNSKIPLGKFAWLILVAVIAAPTAFFVLVTPKEPEEPSTPAAVKLPPSKLAAVGLRENRDWDGLPEIFAVWADKAYWEHDRTRFAYWNPATRSYSYFLEARRTPKGYRFREIPEPHDPDFVWDPDATDDIPLRLFLPKKGDMTVFMSVRDRGVMHRSEPRKVEIDVASPKLAPEPPKKP